MSIENHITINRYYLDKQLDNNSHNNNTIMPTMSSMSGEGPVTWFHLISSAIDTVSYNEIIYLVLLKCCL